MKRFGPLAEEIAAKAARHREFRWCRHQNGFCDKPIWRLVAETLSMPVHQVVAFANRLEELANASDPRGYVGDFSASEFAAALGMRPEEAAGIYAALERPEIGWLDQDHVVTFYQRNPDKEDLSAAERKRASRARKKAMTRLGEMARRGLITPLERNEREMMVLGARSETEVRVIMSQVQHARAADQNFPGKKMSTGHAGHIVTDRDIVTVTPRADQTFTARPVDNSGDAARGEAAGLSDQEGAGSARDPQASAELWMAEQGRQIIMEQLELEPAKADTRIERWLRELDQDRPALAEIIRGAEKTGYMGAPFHNLIVDGIRRHRIAAAPQRTLPLMPGRPGRAHGR
jgi:hypothetical protein